MFFEEYGEKRAELTHPLVLSYIGDAVLTLYAREMLAGSSDMKSGGLHKLTTKYVSAYGQAAQYDAVSGMLSTQEADIARRARNSHNTSKAKNTDLETYKKASAFEAVIGYLYLTGQTQRMTEIINKGFEVINGKTGT